MVCFCCSLVDKSRKDKGQEGIVEEVAVDEDKKIKLLTQSKQLNRMTRRQCQCNRSQSKAAETRVQVRVGVGALEERISTTINDFGCVFTTLTGEKMGSTSTAQHVHHLTIYIYTHVCKSVYTHLFIHS